MLPEQAHGTLGSGDTETQRKQRVARYVEARRKGLAPDELDAKSRRRNRCTRLRARARIGTCGKCLRTTAAVFTEASTSSMDSTKSFVSPVFAASSSSRREASP